MTPAGVVSSCSFAGPLSLLQAICCRLLFNLRGMQHDPVCNLRAQLMRRLVRPCTTQDDSLLLALAEPLLTAARAENQLQVERMLRLCQEGAALQQQAEEEAGRLRDLFYSLTAQLKEARAACVSTASCCT